MALAPVRASGGNLRASSVVKCSRAGIARASRTRGGEAVNVLMCGGIATPSGATLGHMNVLRAWVKLSQEAVCQWQPSSYAYCAFVAPSTKILSRCADTLCLYWALTLSYESSDIFLELQLQVISSVAGTKYRSRQSDGFESMLHQFGVNMFWGSYTMIRTSADSDSQTSECMATGDAFKPEYWLSHTHDQGIHARPGSWGPLQLPRFGCVCIVSEDPNPKTHCEQMYQLETEEVTCL
ncbi:hypothetical protein FOMPIDRAFT_1017911 [Fomitopsis schrenkii]|uniref:Uncharacterized protein n=1 Tax=Fomitopsis schrenkii TaxID=2126942 RepID=S8E0G4_FOMSC|nr:hypothetical protein FOMPIDRAFT_1017911 [Fomitopsis schrenkii]